MEKRAKVCRWRPIRHEGSVSAWHLGLHVWCLMRVSGIRHSIMCNEANSHETKDRRGGPGIFPLFRIDFVDLDFLAR